MDSFFTTADNSAYSGLKPFKNYFPQSIKAVGANQTPVTTTNDTGSSIWQNFNISRIGKEFSSIFFKGGKLSFKFN